MIDSIIKILKKLDHNITTYNVSVEETKWGDNLSNLYYRISFYQSDTKFFISISNTEVSVNISTTHNIGSALCENLTEDTRHEILHLARVLYKQSQEFTKDKLVEFVNG